MPLFLLKIIASHCFNLFFIIDKDSNIFIFRILLLHLEDQGLLNFEGKHIFFQHLYVKKNIISTFSDN